MGNLKGWSAIFKEEYEKVCTEVRAIRNRVQRWRLLTGNGSMIKEVKKMSLKQEVEITSKFNELSEVEKTMVFTEVVRSLQNQNNPLVEGLEEIIEMIKIKQK
ncbi:hypothetical protein AAHB61_30105 [Bacillus cereus]